KGKLALAVAGCLVSKKLRAKPQEMLATKVGKLGDSPQLSQLTDQVRGEVLSVGRQALKAVADRRLGAFADSLADRTKSLSETMDTVAGKLKEEGEDEGEGDEETEPRGEGGRDRPEAKSAKRPPRDTAERSAPAKKTAKKAPLKKAAKKTAQKRPADQSRRRR
ncbi:MAG: hypothetical protein ACRDOV_08445, partial [Streptomyces sp.]